MQFQANFVKFMRVTLGLSCELCTCPGVPGFVGSRRGAILRGWSCQPGFALLQMQQELQVCGDGPTGCSFSSLHQNATCVTQSHQEIPSSFVSVSWEGEASEGKCSCSGGGAQWGCQSCVPGYNLAWDQQAAGFTGLRPRVPRKEHQERLPGAAVSPGRIWGSPHPRAVA